MRPPHGVRVARPGASRLYMRACVATVRGGCVRACVLCEHHRIREPRLCAVIVARESCSLCHHRAQLRALPWEEWRVSSVKELEPFGHELICEALRDAADGWAPIDITYSSAQLSLMDPSAALVGRSAPIFQTCAAAKKN